MTPILLFDPRREHSFVPITKSCHRRDAGTVKTGRIFAATRGGLALIGPSTAACLPAWAKGAARWPISNRWFSSIFTPLLTKIDLTFAEGVRSRVVHHELANEHSIRGYGNERERSNPPSFSVALRGSGKSEASMFSTQIGSGSFTSWVQGECPSTARRYSSDNPRHPTNRMTPLLRTTTPEPHGSFVVGGSRARSHRSCR